MNIKHIRIINNKKKWIKIYFFLSPFYFLYKNNVMILQELMHFEEKLLLCENNNRFTMSFNDYIILDKFLTEVENITNLYFQLMDEYKKYLNKKDIKNDERINLLNEYNNKLLNEEIEFNFINYEDFIKKFL
jgi:hypothetical protein